MESINDEILKQVQDDVIFDEISKPVGDDVRARISVAAWTTLWQAQCDILNNHFMETRKASFLKRIKFVRLKNIGSKSIKD